MGTNHAGCAQCNSNLLLLAITVIVAGAAPADLVVMSRAPSSSRVFEQVGGAAGKEKLSFLISLRCMHTGFTGGRWMALTYSSSRWVRLNLVLVDGGAAALVGLYCY